MDTDQPIIPQPIEPEQAEPEIYVEPPKMAGKDIAGVVTALVVLTVIGWAGYIWLNPALTWRNALGGKQAVAEQVATPNVKTGTNETPSQPAQPPAPLADETASVQSTNADSGTEKLSQDQPAAPNTAEDFTCAQCGMDASRSASHVIAHWADGSREHFDSWDCAFKYAKEQVKKLSSAEVNRFGDDPASPNLLAAAKAWFLYGTTKRVTGSMPPYVAAYPDEAEAKSAQPEMGGEILDFAGLKAKWE